MKKHYFLGLAANYSPKMVFSHLFSFGTRKDCNKLIDYLNKKYNGEVALVKNGRTALSLALMAYFNKGDKILVNGFTCYAVYEAVKAAGLKPVFVDIDLGDLNFDFNSLEKTIEKESGLGTTQPQGIIIQNTFGNPINIDKIKKLAKKYNLTIIEDLAHSVGIKYPSGEEAGTIGKATILSFGKEKSIDTILGGAVIFRDKKKNEIILPNKLPRLSDHLRAKFYPFFGMITRALTRVRFGGIIMRGLVKIHFVEKSADNKLDFQRKISKFEARRALFQLEYFARNSKKPLREFYFVKNRDDVLKELRKEGYYFDGFWYEKPVSPERYYKKVHFPEEKCKNAVYAANHIINLPNYYKESDLKIAKKIIESNLEEKK